MFEKVFVFISLLCLLLIPVVDVAAPSMVLPDCNYKCGNVSIPYPFGIGVGCYHDKWYEVTCNASFNSTVSPILRKLDMEVLNISIGSGDDDNALITLNSPIVPHCLKQGKSSSSSTWNSTNFSGSPFNVSVLKNLLTVVGCNNAVLTYDGEIIAGCTSECRSDVNMKGCYGINCCQTPIPHALDSYSITISGNTTTVDCTYAFLATSTSGNFSGPNTISETTHVPVSLDWTIKGINKGESLNYSCSTKIDEYYSCYCGWGFEGNPYILNGCKVVEPCTKCQQTCGHNSTTQEFFCYPSVSDKFQSRALLAIGLAAGLSLGLLCSCCYGIMNCIKRRRTKKHKQKFFKRNGGLLLQQQIVSSEGTIAKTIVFTSKQLEKATDNFSRNRIIGQGGQGTVYKGMLKDGKTVAIKKSKVVDESQVEQFINEVVILSQINHRNIVKLLGCCLETDVPFIVYEFISNGNLLELIHGRNEGFLLSWKMRLQIATEVAGAVAYLHSASSMPIFHRDIKSTNILLDEKYRAKVSDFGTSRAISIEQTHLTTLVHGTFGYLDPEYFQSSQFTEKSDVYSFGVVLVELLTGQKAISLVNSEEERNLATRFILFIEDMRLFDLLDASVVVQAAKEDIIVVADIARRCLSLNGKQRPTMKQVMMELEAIRMSYMSCAATQNNYIHDNECIIETEGTANTMPISGLIHQRSFSSDATV